MIAGSCCGSGQGCQPKTRRLLLPQKGALIAVLCIHGFVEFLEMMNVARTWQPSEKHVVEPAILYFDLTGISWLSFHGRMEGQTH